MATLRYTTDSEASVCLLLLLLCMDNAAGKRRGRPQLNNSAMCEVDLGVRLSPISRTLSAHVLRYSSYEQSYGQVVWWRGVVVIYDADIS